MYGHVFVRGPRDPVEGGQRSVAGPLMSRRIGRSIGRRTLINKGYSKEIAIIYTLRARAYGSRVARLLPTGRTYARSTYAYTRVRCVT